MGRKERYTINTMFTNFYTHPTLNAILMLYKNPGFVNANAVPFRNLFLAVLLQVTKTITVPVNRKNH